MTDAAHNGAAAIAAAWFVDPNDASQWRWWDGNQWTEHVAPLVPAGEQAVAVAAVSGVPQDDASSGRWPVPAADAPLFPSNGYPKDVHPGFVAPRRSLHVRRAPITLLKLIAGVVLQGIGGSMNRGFNEMGSDNRLEGEGRTLMKRAFWDVYDDARDKPWSEVFRRRGLDEGAGIHSRWVEIIGIATDFQQHGFVQPRWVAGGEVAGMPATCGEVYAEREDEDCNTTREYRMFAAFELPLLAAARHRKVVVTKRGLPAKVTLGAPRGMRAVEFESIAVNKALRVHVDASTDDVTVRELFGPQLLAALAEHPVAWNQKRDLLIVHRDVPREPGIEFDAFMRSAAAVARAYWMDQD